MFGRKAKKKGSDPSRDGSGSDRPVRVKRIGKDSMRSARIEVSNVPVVVDDIKGVDGLAIEIDGRTAWGGIIWDGSGQFTRAMRKQEDIGGIIEHVRARHISTLIDDEMMDAEHMFIICDIGTVTTMGEYTRLIEAPYTAAWVDADGKVTDTGCEVSYDQVSDAILGGGGLERLFRAIGALPEQPEPSGADASPAPEGAADATVVMGAVSDAPFPSDAASDLDEPDEVAPSAAEAAIASEPIADPAATPAAETVATPRTEAATEAAPFDPMAVEEADEIEEIDETEEAERTYSRTFYFDGLDLEITAAPFDLQLVHGNEFRPICPDLGEGWLSEQASEFARQENARLEADHADNIGAMRSKFSALVSGLARRIGEKYDMDDPGTEFGAQKVDCLAARERARANMRETIGERRSAAIEAYDAAVAAERAAAADTAERQYRERHGRAHDADLHRIERDVERDVENRYRDDVRELSEMCRRSARTEFDEGVVSALSDITEEYRGLQEEERRAKSDALDRLRVFVDENRKADIARVRVLAEEQSRGDAVREAEERFSARAEQLASDYRAKLDEARDESEAAKSRLLAEVEEVRRRRDADVGDMREQRDEALARLRELMETWDRSKAEAAADAERRLASAKAEVEEWSRRFDASEESQRRGGRVRMALLATAIAAALALGAIGGSLVASTWQADSTQFEATCKRLRSRISDQLDRIDELERREGVTNGATGSGTGSAPSDQTGSTAR